MPIPEISSVVTSLLEILSYRAQFQADKQAYIFLADGENESGSLTYGELDSQARSIAAQIRSFRGERALLLYPSGLEFITAFFGCLYAGVIAVPAYPPTKNQKLSRLKSIVDNAEPKIVLTTTSILTDLEKIGEDKNELARLQSIATDTIVSTDEDFNFQPVNSENVAFLQYTSGSTGNPKGVMVTHGNIIDNQQLIYQAFGHSEHSIGVSWLPLFHDMGLIGHVIHPIYAGTTNILMPPVAFLQKPIRWLEAISKYRATTSGAPNFAYDLCVKKIKSEELTNLDLSSWDLAFNGAEPVRAETLTQFGEKFADCGFKDRAFYPCYGMAETTLFTTGGSKDREPVIQRVLVEELTENLVVESEIASPASRVFVGCGRSYLDSTVTIVNPDLLTPCDRGEVGEIWVSGGSVAAGYWNQPETTRETFQANLGTSEEPFLRTGDLGFFQNDELFVTGRLKDLIIIRGRNHYPQDIELTVEHSHPALQENAGAVSSIEIAGDECLVVVCEVKRTELRKLNIDEIVGKILVAVSTEHELEVRQVLLLRPGSIPKTSSGKIQRSACKIGVLKNSLNVVGEWKRSINNILPTEVSIDPDRSIKTIGEIETWLTAKIAEILEVATVEVDRQQPLAIYGLNSLKAVSIAAELEIWLGIEVAPTIVYEYPNIQALANYLGSTTPILAPSTSSLDREDRSGSIAIIGMGCRFPQAANPQDFWSLLKLGSDAIGKVPVSRWESADGWGGFLEGIDRFDPQFFSISPREASNMDPQQRLLLEVSWEALENAGLAASELAGSRSGVFMGISNGDYARLNGNLANTETYYATGNALSIAANRLSYFLDWHSPSLAMDTACSSSLVAVHQACQSLISGESNLALAGGVNLMLSPQLTLTFTAAQMMAADGRCKTFDAAADGYVRSEGCGVVVLKRLADAIADGDNIQAVIRGSAVNQDGQTNGLTAPNGNSQQEVIRLALAKAGVTADRISYVEAHGTGTALGDPIELNALKAVLMEGRESAQTCWIGSVKTNIGHLEAAAGIAGLIKTVLSLKHGEIPPHLHLDRLNPYIKLEDTPIEIPTQLQSWSSGEYPRLAGVSAFGFGGTNAHLILEEAPVQLLEKNPSIDGQNLLESQDKNLGDRPLHLLTLSAKTDKALRKLVTNYQSYLENSPAESDIASICFSANTGRSHFDRRLAILAADKQELIDRLVKVSDEEDDPGIWAGKLYSSSKPPKIAYLFTGQGSQYVNMGRQLYETQPVFRQTIEQCDRILQPYLEKSLLDIIYPDDPQLLDNSIINQTAYTQPALFAIEYALFQLWQSWGIKPDVVMGHSVGEYVAATVAGVFGLEDGLKLIAHRGRLMQQLPVGGEMVAVMASVEVVDRLIAPFIESVAIAAINGVESVVISGEAIAIGTIIANLELAEIKTIKIQVSHAFHSPLMAPMLAEFTAIAEQITYNLPSMPIVSNLTGSLADDSIATANYWVNHIIQPVKFAQSMETLNRSGCQVFIEIGAKPILLGMGRECLSMGAGVWLPSLRFGQADWEVLLSSLAELSVLGVKVDWGGFDRNYPRRKLVLPTYPFQRERYWIEEEKNDPPVDQKQPLSTYEPLHPLIDRRLHLAGLENQIRFECLLSADRLTYLKDHCVFSQPVFPAAGYLEIVLAAGAILFNSPSLILEDVAIQQALILSDEIATIQVILTPQSAQTYSFQIFSLELDEENSSPQWTLHVRGKLLAGDKDDAPESTDLVTLKANYSQQISPQDFYQEFKDRGIDYGSSFQAVRQLWRDGEKALGQIQLSETLNAASSKYQLHPVLLDASFQVLAAALDLAENRDIYLPIAIERLKVYHTAPHQLWTEVEISKPTANPQTLTGEIRLLNEQGIVVAEVEGLILFRTSPQALVKTIEPDIDHWLYQIHWQPQVAAPQIKLRKNGEMGEGGDGGTEGLGDFKNEKSSSESATPPGNWLLFAPSREIGQDLVESLNQQGQQSILVTPGANYQQLSPQHYQVNPIDGSDFLRLCQESLEHQPPLSGIVHLWSLSETLASPQSAQELQTAQELGCASVLHLIQALGASQNLAMPQLWLVTHGTQSVGNESLPVQFQQAPLWGLGGVIALEQPQLQCRRIDLDPSVSVAPAMSVLLPELLSPDVEDRIAYRQGVRHLARLVRHQEIPTLTGELSIPRQPFQLKLSAYGMLDNLSLQPLQRRLPDEQEVEIQVRAVGLNFRDVLNTLGVLKDYYAEHMGITSAKQLTFGFECAGTIVAVGAGVAHLQVGDEVMATMLTDAFSSFITTRAEFVVPQPSQISSEAAATIPLAFLTAYYGLHHLAKIQPGDRVLIHAAAGGVGQAAIQLAQQAGAEIFATASPSKWEFLNQIGVQYVMNSRTLDFTDRVLELTEGRGVDIVFNSLTGEVIPKNLEILAPGGRFVEIGKIGIWDEERVHQTRSDVRYFPFDLGEVAQQQPDLISQMLNFLGHQIDRGELQTLPHKVFPIEQSIAAFRYMQQSKHIGKVVISMPEIVERQVAVSSQASYLITGGLGALGLHSAGWLVAQGAKHLVLAGRKPPSATAQQQIDRLQQAGVQILVLCGDISQVQDVSEILQQIETSLPPLRGVIHAAGLLDDGLLSQMSWERFTQVMAPKVQGAWHLHTLTQELPLDFFVCFSSIASLLGSPGQGNYAAANAFMDALVHQRREMGLPGLSINWGYWAEGGMATELSSQQRMFDRGISPIFVDRGLQVFGDLLAQDPPQVGVLPIDWAKFSKQLPIGGQMPLLAAFTATDKQSQPGKSDFLQQLALAPVAERRELLMIHVRQQIARVLGLTVPEQIGLRQSLFDLGIDSLMALELNNALESSLGISISSTILFKYPTLAELVDYLGSAVLEIDSLQPD